MVKYFLHLAYNGVAYHGWQRQAQVPSVQATIEDNLRKMFNSELTIHGCGRTDTGVHARSYYAHLVLEKEVDFDLVYKLNRMLPNDIVIYNVLPVDITANAQLSAVSRTYEYRIHTKKNPFLIDKSALYDLLDLDLQKMKTACQLLVQYKDFRYFCLQPELHNHTLCELSKSEMIIENDGNQLTFRFTANRFLRGMIRIIVGRLLDVGRGQVSIEELKKSLELEQANKYMTQAYPQGLYLTEVVYPFL